MNWWNWWNYRLKGKFETTVVEGGQEIEVEISLYRHKDHGGCAVRSRVLGIKTYAARSGVEPERLRLRRKRRRVDGRQPA